MGVTRPTDTEFAAFLGDVEPRLRRALSASLGANDGRAATQASLTWAWEHWSRVTELTNPAGYLYRVGMTSATRSRPREIVTDSPITGSMGADTGVDHDLLTAIDALSPQQRAAVLLVHGHGYSLRDVAELLDLNPSTVRVHTLRGLARLRRALEHSHAD